MALLEFSHYRIDPELLQIIARATIQWERSGLGDICLWREAYMGNNVY